MTREATAGEPGAVNVRRILCPVDFSDVSRHALEHAIAVAKWYDSKITALHVIHAPGFLPQPPLLFAEPSDSVMPLKRRQELEQQLREWLEPADRGGLATEVVFDDGQPVARILAHASTLQVDLIVMGTHGLSGFDRFIMGSVTEKVLRKAECPVMTVPPASVTTANVPYTRLLCPVDFSASSQAALRFTFSLAEESDAHLTLLHVLDWPPDDELLVEGFDVPEFREALEERTRGRLEALVPDEVRVWCKPVTKVTYGKAYQQIVEVAAVDRVDAIVIGVRGRSPVDLTLFGSTTNQVIRRASCPVITLRE